MRVLITGITGFAGSHLAERLIADGDQVHGIARGTPPFRHLSRIAHKVCLHKVDITQPEEVRAAVVAANPDVVFHLAAQAVPSQAAANPFGTSRTNVIGTAAVLNAIGNTPLVMASSADVYGSPVGLVDETVWVDPGNPYAASKAAAEVLARQRGDVVIIRPTNQIGPRQHPELAASAFAKQIAEAEAGLREPVIRHGSLVARKDLLDVRDMAVAYACAGRMRGTHLFNVGTGKAVAVSEVLDILLSLARIPMGSELDPSRSRPGTPSHYALDATRFTEATGWSPVVGLRTSLNDLLDYWRAQISEAI